MQAYQSAPCPYCGATWNPPGAQTCANCRNQLPAAPTYAPPGYAPGGQQYGPEQGQGGPQAYPGQPGYPGQGQAYPGQQGEQPYGNQPGYPQQYGQSYDPSAYGQPPAFPQPGYGPTGYQAYPAYPAYPGQQAAVTQLRLFGRTFSLPIALPAPLKPEHVQSAVYAAIGFVGLLILLFGVLPAIASGQVAYASQSVTVAVSHRSTVDAGLNTFLHDTFSSNDLNASKAHVQSQVDTMQKALTLVQSDESSITSADQRLSILAWIALPSKDMLADQQQRDHDLLQGLQQADQALTAGVNQGRLAVTLYDATIDYSKVLTALNKRDVGSAGAYYPDEQAKLDQARALAQASGIPTQLTQEVNAYATLLDDTEKFIQALQAKDVNATKKYSAQVTADSKKLSSFNDSAIDDYNLKTFGAMQTAYDKAVKSAA
jgi:hypothetical protein